MRALFPIVAVVAIVAIAAGSAHAQSPRVGELARISFPAGSADPNGEVDQQLDEAKAWAARHPEGVIVLDGHATTARLSHDRAVAIRDQLVEAGVDPHQIIIAVFADKGPDVVIWGARQ
jgi:outer membrane protein OmpA-like peptidoglycan-associated protein